MSVFHHPVVYVVPVPPTFQLFHNRFELFLMLIFVVIVVRRKFKRYVLSLLEHWFFELDELSEMRTLSRFLSESVEILRILVET